MLVFRSSMQKLMKTRAKRELARDCIAAARQAAGAAEYSYDDDNDVHAEMENLLCEASIELGVDFDCSSESDEEQC